MIFWITVWVLTSIVITLLFLMEMINGSLEWRFWLITILILFLVISMVFAIGAYQQSIQFCAEFNQVKNIANQLTTENQELTYLSQVINYNHYLQLYQAKAKQLGIFSPYCRELLKLEDIQLKYYDISIYTWEQYP